MYWLRLVLLIPVIAWGIYGAIKRRKPVLRRLVGAAGTSTWRAFGAVTAYVVALWTVFAVCGVLAIAIHQLGSDLAARAILFANLAITGPYLLLLAPSGNEGEVTSFRDLRRLTAPKGVARAIAYPGFVYFILSLFCASFTAFYFVMSWKHL